MTSFWSASNCVTRQLACGIPAMFCSFLQSSSTLSVIGFSDDLGTFACHNIWTPTSRGLLFGARVTWGTPHYSPNLNHFRSNHSEVFTYVVNPPPFQWSDFRMIHVKRFEISSRRSRMNFHWLRFAHHLFSECIKGWRSVLESAFRSTFDKWILTKFGERVPLGESQHAP